MIHEGEYLLITQARLEELQKQGWNLVGYVRRPGYIGSYPDNVLVRRSTSKLPLPDPPLEANP